MLSAHVLSDAEKEIIHRESLKILEKVGVRVKSASALKILAMAGAKVDYDNNIALIDSSMVEQALASAPKSITLGARNSVHDFPMPSLYTGYTLDGTASFTMDFETGQRRYGTLKDIEMASRVFESVSLGTINWPPVSATDAAPNCRVLYEFITSLKHASKHVQHELNRPEEVPFLIEAMKSILGNTSEVRKRKICSVCYCPVAPLTHEGPMSEAYLELVKYEVPVLIYPMPACGSTGPASLFSNICVANAEGLSALTLFQAAQPGSPQIYGAASGTIDFATGAFLEGSPEMVIQTAAMGEMARYYNLPNTQAGCLSDAKQPGPEAVTEKMLTTIPLVLAGVDLINGFGEIEASQMLVLEQIIVDEEIAQLCRRLREGVNPSEMNHLFDVIQKVGPGGHYLGEKSTRKQARSGEFYRPQLFDRNTFNTWQELGRPDIYQKARDKVREVLEGPVLNPLPEAVTFELDDILNRASVELP